MKKFILFLLFTSSIISSLKAQNGNFKIITSDFGLSNKSPLLIKAGDTLQIECDSVFLINKGRYNFYKNIHSSILNNNDSTCTRLLNSYEIRLSEHEKTFSKLIENSRIAEKTTFELLTETQNSLSDTRKTLGDVQFLLENTRKNLEIANDHIKKERWNNAGKKFLIGVGGVAVGIITGVLIMK